MKRIGKFFLFLGWIVVFIYLLVGFLPKAGLYYLGEQKLAEKKIFISGEKVSDRFFGFGLSGGQIYYEGIHVAPMPEIDLTTLLFYNTLTVEGFRFSEDVADFVPPEFGGLAVTHSILAPHKVFLSGDGDFGSIAGETDLLERKLHLVFSPSAAVSKQYPALKRYFKKTKEGLVYEIRF